MSGKGDQLLLIGAGGHGKVVAEIAEACGYAKVVFADDAWPGLGAVGRWPVLGNLASVDELVSRDHFAVLASIGDNRFRAGVYQDLQARGLTVPVLVHPAAVISPSARLSAGTVAMAGVVVNADAVIGEAVILNTAATIDHDCVLEKGVHLSPGVHLGGGVHIGARAWIGIGASVRHGIEIGPDAVVGAGSAVIRDVAPGSVIGGAPARPLRREQK